MNSKRKGTRGENELAEILRAAGIRAYRNDQIYKGGKENPDVFAEYNGHPLHIECKRCEKLNVHAAVQQAIEDAAANALPIVAHRRNREAWLITIPLPALLEFLKEAQPT